MDSTGVWSPGPPMDILVLMTAEGMVVSTVRRYVCPPAAMEDTPHMLSQDYITTTHHATDGLAHS